MRALALLIYHTLATLFCAFGCGHASPTPPPSVPPVSSACTPKRIEAADRPVRVGALRLGRGGPTLDPRLHPEMRGVRRALRAQLVAARARLCTDEASQLVELEADTESPLYQGPPSGIGLERPEFLATAYLFETSLDLELTQVDTGIVIGATCVPNDGGAAVHALAVFIEGLASEPEWHRQESARSFLLVHRGVFTADEIGGIREQLPKSERGNLMGFAHEQGLLRSQR